MKNLKRLRKLYSKFGTEGGQPPDMRFRTALFNQGETDLEEEAERYHDQDTDLYEHDAPGRTLDGLRKRIPGIHEDHPPDGYGIDSHNHDDLP